MVGGCYKPCVESESLFALESWAVLFIQLRENMIIVHSNQNSELDLYICTLCMSIICIQTQGCALEGVSERLMYFPCKAFNSKWWC